MTDKVRGQNINMKLVRAHLWILSSHSAKTLIPERHGMDDAVGFCRGSQMLASLARQFKSVAQHTIHATAREDGLLHRHFLFRSFIKPAADIGVFSFVIFADDAEFDLARLPMLER